jgi:NAD(P)-dependent dehydrogenase (short-subunit alcohol dehydrogenase family)
MTSHPQAACLLVTGGSRGIGAAIVRLAARRGLNVCFSYLRDEAAAQRLAAELEGGGGRVRFLRGDVADARFGGRFFDFAHEVLGTPTMLVNNAGVTGPIGRFQDATIETFRRTIDTNLLGPMMLAQEAVRRWEAAGIAGRMVNISSIASTLGAPNEYVHYAATKAAIEAMTIGLGKEVAPTGQRGRARHRVYRYPCGGRRARPAGKGRSTRSNGADWRSRRDRRGGHVASFRRSLLCHCDRAAGIRRPLTSAWARHCEA